MFDNKLLSKLSQNLLEILNDEEHYDTTIEVEIFQVILRYIYGGIISLEEYEPFDIIKILVTANELRLFELVSYIESFLIENKKNWMEQHIDLIYQTSFENDSFLELRKYCTDLISKEPDKIFNSPNFSTISEKLLVTLIQNGNLQMNEIQVWEHMIKWGLAQNPELPSDPTNFSKDDFNTLKNTTQQCIPFIKFHNLTASEFSKKVLPYKKILPKELYKDLLEYFLDNDSEKSVPHKIKEEEENYSKNIDSKIITFQHAELISKWINGLEITDKLTTSYEFKLLYRDSRDGSNKLNSRFIKFHENCKNQPRTVTIIKVVDSNEILGGYNPLEWKSDDSYGITKDSFIFSFRNDNIENYILSRVKNEKKALFNSFCYYEGPSFGCKDLHLYQNFANDLRIYCKKYSYENQLKEINYSYFSDFEVFQIM
ncbi:carbohydrate-binding module family 13 protein [Rhizophagus clarus]|uniref:Carbohydrate-binding module family 13 protein n=1 Tax=Rhizophagus clarus TaxID=94130 RepID=A0A8H3QE24_9GLOM|nr:carbohydrate-binding module family 13 protein [Rhizophagus clarus]